MMALHLIYCRPTCKDAYMSGTKLCEEQQTNAADRYCTVLVLNACGVHSPATLLGTLTHC